MKMLSLTYTGAAYGTAQDPERRVLVLSLGYLSRYYTCHPVTTAPVGVSDIIRMKLEGHGQFERFDPLSKFEWSLRGLETERASSGLWEQLAVDDHRLDPGTLPLALNKFRPTHVLLWDRQKMKEMLDSQIIAPLSVPSLGKAPAGVFRYDDNNKCLLMGMGNPTKAFPWLEWHKTINNFIIKDDHYGKRS